MPTCTKVCTKKLVHISEHSQKDVNINAHTPTRVLGYTRTHCHACRQAHTCTNACKRNLVTPVETHMYTCRKGLWHIRGHGILKYTHLHGHKCKKKLVHTRGHTHSHIYACMYAQAQTRVLGDTSIYGQRYINV